MTATAKNIGAVLVIVVAITFGIFVWPTSYRYEHMNVGEGRSFPVRVHRLTGKTEVLYPSGWEVADSKQEPTTELTPEEIKKLSGNAVITNIGYIEADIYNGTNKNIREIVVSVTVQNVPIVTRKDLERGTLPAGKLDFAPVVFAREYVLTPHGSTRPLASATYSADLGYKIQPNQTFSWNIVRATGEKPDRD